MQKIKSTISLLLSLSIFLASVPSYGADSGISLSKEIIATNKGNEYISGDYPGAVMMKINLWGGVNKPGIHYVPAKTDIVTLLSYAGGPTEKAESDNIIIKRTVSGKQIVIDVDVDDIMHSTKSISPVLEANDIIVVPSRKPFFSENTVQVIGVVGGVLGIILASIVLKKTFKEGSY